MSDRRERRASGVTKSVSDVSVTLSSARPSPPYLSHPVRVRVSSAPGSGRPRMSRTAA